MGEVLEITRNQEPVKTSYLGECTCYPDGLSRVNVPIPGKCVIDRQ